MPSNLIGGLVIALLVVLAIFGAIAGLIVIYHRSKNKASAKLEPGDRGYEREAKIFTLYQNLEDMLDGFDSYIEETRTAFEMEKIELLRGREEMSRMHANILALSEKMDKQVRAYAEEKDALSALHEEMRGEAARLTELREAFEKQKAELEEMREKAAEIKPVEIIETIAAEPEEEFIPTRPQELTRAVFPAVQAIQGGAPARPARIISKSPEPTPKEINLTRPIPAEPAATSTSGRAVTIRNLHQSGLTVDEIARELGLARNEVALTLKLMGGE